MNTAMPGGGVCWAQKAAGLGGTNTGPPDHLQNGALKMAEQTVAERADKYGYDDVREALRKTAQAMAMMRVLSLAVAAQEDGSVIYDDNKFSRWGPVVDAACERVHAVRDSLQNKANAPHAVDWWTSLAILEATGGGAVAHGRGTSTVTRPWRQNRCNPWQMPRLTALNRCSASLLRLPRP